MVSNVIFLILVVWATIGTIATTTEFATLGLQAPDNPLGRLVFGTIVSLKTWVFLILADFFVAILVPHFVTNHREAIRFGLAVYLVVQTTTTFIAVRRYKKSLKKGK